MFGEGTVLALFLEMQEPLGVTFRWSACVLHCSIAATLVQAKYFRLPLDVLAQNFVQPLKGSYQKQICGFE